LGLEPGTSPTCEQQHGNLLASNGLLSLLVDQ
jgi:hypothetical protein